MQWLTSLTEGAVAQFILGSSWLYYGLLAVHAIGMAGVVGGTLMLCIRVLGYAVGAPVSDLEQLRNIAAWGFVINASSGVLIFMTNAAVLALLWTFQLKMASILIGALLLMALWREIGPNRDDPQFRFGGKAKVIAGATIFFWIAAIVSGRYIAYTLPMV